MNWEKCIEYCAKQTRITAVPREIQQLVAQKSLRISTAGFSCQQFKFLELLIEKGIDQLTELSIHFNVEENLYSPLQPGGDHYGYLNFVNYPFPAKLMQHQEFLPVQHEDSPLINSLFKVIANNLPRAR